jgi:Transposase zinc-ribbon domain/ISXO2-like transposase domain
MAKNVVQFQKGLSEAAFQSQYGTEEQCRTALFSWRWPQGFVCPKCGGTHSVVLRTRPIHQCSTCRHQVSLIAGTIFHSTKLRLTTWFAAIYHLTQGKNGLSSLELARRLGVSHYTAWKIQHKLMQIMLERDQDKPLTGERIEVDDAYIGGERSGGKRGRGSAGKTPFVAAVETTAEGKPVRVKFSRTSAGSRSKAGRCAICVPPGRSTATASTPSVASPMPAAAISRSSRVPARRRSGPPPSSGPTPCSATSRPVWPAPSTPSATSTSRAIWPSSNTASTAATICRP